VEVWPTFHNLPDSKDFKTQVAKMLHLVICKGYEFDLLAYRCNCCSVLQLKMPRSQSLNFEAEEQERLLNITPTQQNYAPVDRYSTCVIVLYLPHV
jgi:hypothetical protein